MSFVELPAIIRPAQLLPLLDLLKAETGANRSLDCRVFAAMDNPTGFVCGDERPDSTRIPSHIHPFTDSVDTCLALIARRLPGWKVGTQQNRHPTDHPNMLRRAWSAWLDSPVEVKVGEIEATAPTLPLALLIVTVTALINLHSEAIPS